MALTYSKMIAEIKLGNLRGKIFDVTFDSSYITGGEPLSPAMIGIQNIVGSVQIGAKDATSGAVETKFIPGTTPKLMALRMGAHVHDLLFKNAAVADGATTRVNVGTNLLGANTGGDLTVAGGGANGGVQLSTQAGLAEVSNAVDLSAVQVRVCFLGN